MILDKNIESVYSRNIEMFQVYSYGKLVWEKDYSTIPFTVKATRSGVSVSLRNLNDATIRYSINGGEWKQTTGSLSIDGVKIAELNKDDILRIKTTDTVNCIITGNEADVYGNILSLMYGDDFIGKTSWTSSNSSYETTSTLGFFGGNASGNTTGSSIVNAKHLILPATSLPTGAYASMFANCKVLEVAPQLPATTLSSGCYAYMFAHCDKLITAPKLPATTLAYRCYYNMFYQSGIVTAPKLPATTLAENCYEGMFRGSYLNNAPQLPATTLAPGCYDSMFHACINLFTAPQLPATTLAENCYKDMFMNCDRLTKAPVLLAPILVSGCYVNMFKYCYLLNYVKCLATSSETYLSDCVDDWLYYAAHKTENHSGTLVCKKINGNEMWELYVQDHWWCNYID